MIPLEQPPNPQTESAPRPARFRSLAFSALGRLGAAAEWFFGLASLILGLSTLAAIPVLQFLTFGYLLETSARVARTGRLRDGLFGVRKAARIGSLFVGASICLLPLRLVDSMADSAQLIDPGSRVAKAWRFGLAVLTAILVLHVGIACARGGRLRHFFWPFGNPAWLIRQLRRGGLYAQMRDGLWDFVASLRLWPLFRRGAIGFFGTLAWLLPPTALIASGIRYPLLGPIGALLLGLIVPMLPYLQVGYAVEGRVGLLFSPRAVRERFRRAPWAFAFALSVMLVASLPLYALKIEMVPQDAAWLPSLIFVLFLMPARLLVGWAYSRSERRERPRHWFFRVVGRLAILPVAALYVLVVVLSQYTSWGGVDTLYEQHAFLLPVPFLSR